jgi:hypothetical protein
MVNIFRSWGNHDYGEYVANRLKRKIFSYKQLYSDNDLSYFFKWAYFFYCVKRAVKKEIALIGVENWGHVTLSKPAIWNKAAE